MFVVKHFNLALILFLSVIQLLSVVLAFVLKDRGAYVQKPPEMRGGVHIVMTSHYKEERWMLERLIDSVQANSPTWPVYIVIAAERGSNLVLENWDIQAKYTSLIIHVAIHERGLAGERPGLGSNLHNAINYINAMLPIDPTKAIITKIDGNCVVTNTILNQVENVWRVGDDGTVFQLQLEEIDPTMSEYTAVPYLLKYGFSGYLAKWLMYGNMILPGGVGLMSSFCIPLQLVNSFGNWDPWLIQEDNLTWVRAVLGSRTFPTFQFIRSQVYNASPLTYFDQFKQLERSFCQSCRARAVLYSNLGLRFFSLRGLYALTGLTVDISSRWQGLFMLVFFGQQASGYYWLDWRAWISLLLFQGISTSVSALHHMEAHKTNSFFDSAYCFLTFSSLQIPVSCIICFFQCYCYIRCWVT